jgi:hypothetical protein
VVDEPAADARPAVQPNIRAKGLDRTVSKAPLVYSSPELGSDTAEVRVVTSDEAEGDPASGTTRRPARPNPNRGNRGNSRGNRRKR